MIPSSAIRTVLKWDGGGERCCNLAALGNARSIRRSTERYFNAWSRRESGIPLLLPSSIACTPLAPVDIHGCSAVGSRHGVLSGADFDRMFDARRARKDMRAYRKRGARGATRRLLNAVRASMRERGKADFTHLDIGGGVGVLQHELARDGAVQTTAVDASRPYLELFARRRPSAVTRRGRGGSRAISRRSPIASSRPPS